MSISELIVTSEEADCETRVPIIKTIDQLDDSPVEWLIKDWIPKKNITLLCADGGTGKTFVTATVLADLSSGRQTIFNESDQADRPQKVMFFSGEDVESVLRLRLMAAEANKKLCLISGLDTSEELLTFDSDQLEIIIRAYRPSLVVFDPLQSFIGSSVDMSRRNQMRTALKPLQVLAAKYDMAVLILMHTNKRDGADGRSKMADSSDIWDIARSVVMAGFDSENQRYLSLEKSSYADHFSIPSILFEIRNGRVVVTDRIMMKQRDFEQEKKKSRKPDVQVPTLKSKCCTAILCCLSDHNGRVDQKTLADYLCKAGFTDKTIRTAREQLINDKQIGFNRSNGKVTYYRK